MPRHPRVFVDGGIYHVYNRAAHGEPVFAGDSAGPRFVEILGETLQADGHVVLAWVCMENHVVLRASPVTLTRSFGRVQSESGRWRNRTLRSRGPTWQSRYKAKLVEGQWYLLQVIAYVHLNPVSAGLVDDPAAFLMSGHRQVVALDPIGILAREEVLCLHGSTEKAAMNAYVRALCAVTGSEGWVGSSPGRLPWWPHEPDRPLPAAAQPLPACRPKLEAKVYLAAVSRVQGISTAVLESRSRHWAVSRPRMMVTGLGIERWAQRASELAGLLDRRPDLVSWWALRSLRLRQENEEFAEEFEALDRQLQSECS